MPMDTFDDICMVGRPPGFTTWWETGAMPCGLTPWEKRDSCTHERVNLVAAIFAYIEVGKKGKTGYSNRVPR